MEKLLAKQEQEWKENAKGIAAEEAAEKEKLNQEIEALRAGAPLSDGGGDEAKLPGATALGQANQGGRRMSAHDIEALIQLKTSEMNKRLDKKREKAIEQLKERQQEEMEDVVKESEARVTGHHRSRDKHAPFMAGHGASAFGNMVGLAQSQSSRATGGRKKGRGRKKKAGPAVSPASPYGGGAGGGIPSSGLKNGKGKKGAPGVRGRRGKRRGSAQEQAQAQAQAHVADELQRRIKSYHRRLVERHDSSSVGADQQAPALSSGTLHPDEGKDANEDECDDVASHSVLTGIFAAKVASKATARKRL